MPIRFRCVYCDKLLGIARRKAGAVVNCPHCSEKLIVPTPESGDENEGMEEARGTEEDKLLEATAGPKLFERSDFERLLAPEPTFRAGDDVPVPSTAPSRPSESPPQAPLPVAPKPNPSQQPLVPAPLPAHALQPGFVVSSSRLTWLSVAAVFLLAVAFGLGLVVGRMMKS